MENFTKPVVYTCVTAGYSSVVSPPPELLEEFHFVLLSVDNVEVSGWNSVRIPVARVESNRRVAKRPKIQPWNYFSAHTSIWIDGNMSINVLHFLNAYREFQASRAVLGLCMHNKRLNLEQEFSDVRWRLKDDPQLIGSQYEYYSTFKPLSEIKLYQGGLLFRNHASLELREMMHKWQEHIDVYSVRDQLSLSFILDQSALKNVMLMEHPITSLVSIKPHLKFTSDHQNLRGRHLFRWKVQEYLYKILTHPFFIFIKSKLK